MRLALGLAVVLALSWAVGLYLLLSDDEPSGAEKASTPPQNGGGVLFVQKGSSGALRPLPGQQDAYRLTLNGVDPNVTFFADRPERLAGTISNKELLAGAFDQAGDPPNAALAVDPPGEPGQAIVPVELSEPRLDRKAARMTYLATLLDNPRESLAGFAYSDPAKAPLKFGAIELFIDAGDYPDACFTTLHTGDAPLFLKSADPALGNSHYETVETSINAYSEGRITLIYNAEKGFFEDEGGYHADFYYEYPDGTSVHVHPHCNIEGIYLRDTECTITDPNGSERACRHESGPDDQGGRLIDFFVY
jgi:hypothetical protein